MSELRFPKINTIVLSGRLTKDPEFKVVGSKQTAIAVMSVAFDDGHMGTDGWVDKSGFVDLTVWTKQAEKAQDLHKGDPIIIEGKLGFESWQTNEGQNRSKLVITGFKVSPLSKSDERISKEPPTSPQPENNIDDSEIPF